MAKSYRQKMRNSVTFFLTKKLGKNIQKKSDFFTHFLGSCKIFIVDF